VQTPSDNISHGQFIRDAKTVLFVRAYSSEGHPKTLQFKKSLLNKSYLLTYLDIHCYSI